MTKMSLVISTTPVVWKHFLLLMQEIMVNGIYKDENFDRPEREKIFSLIALHFNNKFCSTSHWNNVELDKKILNCLNEILNDDYIEDCVLSKKFKIDEKLVRQIKYIKAAVAFLTSLVNSYNITLDDNTHIGDLDYEKIYKLSCNIR